VSKSSRAHTDLRRRAAQLASASSSIAVLSRGREYSGPVERLALVSAPAANALPSTGALILSSQVPRCPAPNESIARAAITGSGPLVPFGGEPRGVVSNSLAMHCLTSASGAVSRSRVRAQ
jgi:hypothetical protein